MNDEKWYKTISIKIVHSDEFKDTKENINLVRGVMLPIMGDSLPYIHSVYSRHVYLGDKTYGVVIAKDKAGNLHAVVTYVPNMCAKVGTFSKIDVVDDLHTVLHNMFKAGTLDEYLNPKYPKKVEVVEKKAEEPKIVIQTCDLLLSPVCAHYVPPEIAKEAYLRVKRNKHEGTNTTEEGRNFTEIDNKFYYVAVHTYLNYFFCLPHPIYQRTHQTLCNKIGEICSTSGFDLALPKLVKLHETFFMSQLWDENGKSTVLPYTTPPKVSYASRVFGINGLDTFGGIDYEAAFKNGNMYKVRKNNIDYVAVMSKDNPYTFHLLSLPFQGFDSRGIEVGPVGPVNEVSNPSHIIRSFDALDRCLHMEYLDSLPKSEAKG